MTSQSLRDLQIYEGGNLGPFIVESFLGEGGFGVVAKCYDPQNNRPLAIKVNKNDQKIFHQARQEITNLRRLQSLDPDNYNIVKWYGFFFHMDSVCLSFELLDQSLYDYIQSSKGQFFPVPEMRSVLKQMTSALSHLSSIGLVHGDLKPENIMVVDRHSKPLKVKLIDFGLARPVSDCHDGAWVQTLCYRAPEVLMQLPYDEAVDMWTLGVTAAEIAIGFMLYPGHTEYNVLSYITQLQGQPEDHVVDKSLNPGYFFTPEDAAPRRWRLKSPEEFQAESGYLPQLKYHSLDSLDDLEKRMDLQRGHEEDHHLLMDLVKKMLDTDPEQRIKPHEVLQHPFMTEIVPPKIL
ncbi:homeodomain-interacting protein kinase 2-like [Xyrichtys novacula]|uniref:Homeodomain-interacting protein kinase 2-like n=1 Tax=Xyrichtys novacula TaxID=13765 RepID=A0AAV1F2F3_XYRNO|nr:homeodomain-interacting protein kinase 2-like [Xyrichtys novacula]